MEDLYLARSLSQLFGSCSRPGQLAGWNLVSLSLAQNRDHHRKRAVWLSRGWLCLSSSLPRFLASVLQARPLAVNLQLHLGWIRCQSKENPLYTKYLEVCSFREFRSVSQFSWLGDGKPPVLINVYIRPLITTTSRALRIKCYYYYSAGGPLDL